MPVRLTYGQRATNAQQHCFVCYDRRRNFAYYVDLQANGKHTNSEPQKSTTTMLYSPQEGRQRNKQSAVTNNNTIKGQRVRQRQGSKNIPTVPNESITLATLEYF